jgi:hypothetical protein
MENTSGMGKSADIPREIIRWNWGACIFCWIWGIRNRTYIAFLSLIPVFGFLIMLILGLKGNEWAWQNRQWESIEQFQREQNNWSKWGLRFGFVMLMLGIIGAVTDLIHKIIDMFC